MRYRKLGPSDLNVSVLGVGTWGMGGIGWTRSGEANDDVSIAVLRHAVELGVNLFDTAQTYGLGHAEELLAEAFSDMRDKVIIADKCVSFRASAVDRPVRDWRPEVLQFQVEGSLKRLKSDYIDLLQVHWPDANPEHPLKDAFVQLNKFREEGIVRYVGVSNFTPELIEEAEQYCPIVSIQPPYCMLNRGADDVILPYCAKRDLGVLTYGSLGGGILTGKYTEPPKFDPALGRDVRNDFYPYYSEEKWPKVSALIDVLREVAKKRNCPVAHVSIAWTLQREGVTTALVGARTIEQMDMNAAAAEVILTDEEMQIITAASDAAIAE